jgi:SAM-dependent methyltransferase
MWAIERMPGVKVLPRDETLALLNRQIRDKAAAGPLRILDAGCGDDIRFDVSGLDYTLVGVDIDPEVIAQRRARGYPNEELHCADLATVDLPDGAFDLIYNSYLMEHVSGAETVMNNFARWLAPGGLIIMRIPDSRAVYGAMAKVLPHWFHIAFRKHMLGEKDAGKPGKPPFPTIYDPIVSLDGVRRFSEEQGLELVEVIGYDGRAMKEGSPRKLVLDAITKTIGALSLGAWHTDYTNLAFVLKRPETASA